MKTKLLGILILLFACSEGKREKDPIQQSPIHYNANINNLDFDLIPFPKLSDYGFFEDGLSILSFRKEVIPYQPSSSLFTDYASKSRFIWMPKGENATFVAGDPEGKLTFPDKTILIKNFYYPIDFGNPDKGRRMIETRLMVKRNGEWEAFPYVWNENQSDASYKLVGATFDVEWKSPLGGKNSIKYVVPNKNQCKSCHNENESMVPLGVKGKFLDHEFDYGQGKENQLLKWEKIRLLKEVPEGKSFSPVINYEDDKNPLSLRARAYLDINCAHCHRIEGPASTSGLFLTYEEKDPSKLGIYKTPVAAGLGAGSHTFDIVPGKADESILTYRMSSTAVGVAMPEIGRGMIHDEGVELIRAWIDAMGP